MGGIATIGGALAVEEARLAGAAAAGDASAFASLYERYEQRVYNLAYRIAGSEPDAADATQEAFLRAMRRPPEPQGGEPDFRSCLFTATRNACYDLIEKRPASQPGDAMPGPATTNGTGEGDSAARQEEIRVANMHLPEHQREALALVGLEELSYEEIAAIMETNRSSVAELVSRARINLDDELHGTVLATVAAPSPECERALPLIAAREDEQLEPGSDDEAWLGAHLAGCERCRRGVEAMREADASYRAWAPIAAVPWLFKGTMAKAAGLAGTGWSEEVLPRADPPSTATMPPAYVADGSKDRPSSRRRALAGAGLAALLLGGGIATVLAGGEPAPTTPDRPVADTHPARTAPASKPRKKRHSRHQAALTKAPLPGPTTASTTLASEPEGSAPSEPAAAPDSHRATSGLQPPQPAAAPEPKSKSKPTPGAASQPAAAPVAPVETQPPTETATEVPSQEHGKGKGPPPGVPSSGGR